MLGYDPVRVGRLRRLLEDALRELDALDVHDTGDTGRVVRWARARLRDDVLPTVARITRCAALDRGWSWQVAGDWVIGDWVIAVSIAASSEGSASVLHSPVPGSLTAWAADVEARWRQAAQRVAHGDHAATAELTTITGQVHELARTMAGRLDAAAVTQLATEVPPLVLALLLDGLGLTDDDLARWAIDAQRREYASLVSSGSGTYAEWGVANTADVVAATLARRPGAAAQWARVAAVEPGLLFYAADARLEQRALLAATAPGRADAVQAGATLQALIARLHSHGGVLERGDPDAPSWRTFLGEAMAPWFAEFTSDLGRWRWSTNRPDRATALRWVLAEPGADQYLVNSARGALFTLVGAPLLTDGVVEHGRISAFAASAAEFGAARRDAAVEHARRTRGDTDVAVGGVTAGVAQIGGPAGAALSGVVSTAFSTRGRRWLSERGWYPADTASVERDARARWGEEWVTTETVVVRAVAGDLVSAGRLPDEFVEHLPSLPRGCGPDRADEALRTYVLGHAASHPEAVADLLAVIGAFSNTVSAGALCDG
jgi:hypothetical protein